MRADCKSAQIVDQKLRPPDSRPPDSEGELTTTECGEPDHGGQALCCLHFLSQYRSHCAQMS